MPILTAEIQSSHAGDLGGDPESNGSARAVADSLNLRA